jgi:Ni,Fe-hydrogenase III large subunit
MEKMTKKEKFKKFVNDHSDVIAQVVVYTTIVVGSIAIIAKAASDQKEAVDAAIERRNSWVDSENEWLEEQDAAGKDIYLLHNLTYLLVPKDAEVELVEDRIRN